jgi:hypothetical protein
MLIKLKPSSILTGLVLTFSLGFSATSSATLVNNVNGLIYDTAIDITWTQDANLFKTMADSNTNIVSQIISANSGVVHDTPNGSDTVPNSGIYQLSTSDFDTSTGRMNWWGAQAWTGFLSSNNYGGSSQWRLPTTPLSAQQIDPFNVTLNDAALIATSDLGELFYKEMGGIIGSSIATTHNANYNLFSNMEKLQYLYSKRNHTILIGTRMNTGSYWSDTEYRYPDVTVWDHTYIGSTSYAWYLYAENGGLFVKSKSEYSYVWAVHPGDVSAIPEPSLIWLFGIGLLGLIGLTRKSNAA